MIPTPSFSHLSAADFESVYEPAEDTFALLDALEQDASNLVGSRLCLEIGVWLRIIVSSNDLWPELMSYVFQEGLAETTVLTFVHRATVSLCTDLNIHAAKATLLTGKANATPLEPILTDLTSALLPRLQGQVDVLVFNPPYVETEDEEAFDAQQSGVIERAWAGGQAGMRVTDRLLEYVQTLLSKDGAFYLVAVSQNKPYEIIERMKAQGLDGEVTLKRRAGGEHLHILRFRHSVP